MAKGYIIGAAGGGGGGGGTTSDELTATKYNVLEGKTAVTSDSDDEKIWGLLPKSLVLDTIIPDTTVQSEGTLPKDSVLKGYGGNIPEETVLEDYGTLPKAGVLDTFGGTITT